MIPFALVAADFVRTGGMDRANYALASFLNRAGHSLQLVSHRVAGDLANRPGVHFHCIRKPLGSYALGAPFLANAGQQIGRRVAALGGRVVTNGGNCRYSDVNWVHYVCAMYRPDLRASYLRWLERQVENPLERRAEMRALRKARVVVCNSAATRRDVIERIGVPEHKAVVVYYGSDPATFCPASADERAALRQKLGWPADRPVVMFIGALGDRRKGFDTLFDAWTRLCARSDWNADLVVVGRGAELLVWQARCEAAGLTDRIRFLGFRSDVPDLLRAANLLAAPTRYEAYGLGVHEALCCGLPAVVSASAGVAEQYPDACGELLLPDLDDAADLAAAMIAALLKRERLQGPVDALGEHLRSRSWDDMAAEMVHWIESTN